MQQQSQKLWFKAKRYGYGWYPVTWQGWGVLALYLVGVFETHREIDGNPLSFLIRIAILTIFLIIICAAKGEPARWRWGK